jgi:hypothetical protein
VVLNEPVAISGLRLLPRQDGNPNGWIGEVEISVSDDGESWGDPVAKANLSNDANWKTVEFAKPVNASQIRLRAVRPQNPAHPWASLAELELMVKESP